MHSSHEDNPASTARSTQQLLRSTKQNLSGIREHLFTVKCYGKTQATSLRACLWSATVLAISSDFLVVFTLLLHRFAYFAPLRSSYLHKKIRTSFYLIYHLLLNFQASCCSLIAEKSLFSLCCLTNQLWTLLNHSSKGNARVLTE